MRNFRELNRNRWPERPAWFEETAGRGRGLPSCPSQAFENATALNTSREVWSAVGSQLELTRVRPIRKPGIAMRVESCGLAPARRSEGPL